MKFNTIRTMVIALVGFLFLATLSSVTSIWAAPESQGTVPPPPTVPSFPPPGPIPSPATGGPPASSGSSSSSSQGNQNSVSPSSSGQPSNSQGSQNVTTNPAGRAPSSSSPSTSGAAPTPLVRPPAPSSAGQNVFPAPNQVRCVVGGGGSCESDERGNLVLNVPRGAAALGTMVTITFFPSVPPEIVSANAVIEYSFIGRLYQVDAFDPSGNSINFFDPPFDLWLKYSPDDLVMAGGEPSNLRILYYDVKNGGWATKGITGQNIDLAQNRVRAKVSRLGIYALFAGTGSTKDAVQSSVETPTTGNRTEEKSASWFNNVWQWVRNLLSAVSGK